MCLNLPTNYKPKIAKKAVKCYKVLRVLRDNSYETPYQEMKVEIGQAYTSELIIEGRQFIYVGIHSFTSKGKAKLEYDFWKFSGAVIVKCEIPKGSTYYRGTYEDENDSYASDSLKYVEIIEKTIV